MKDKVTGIILAGGKSLRMGSDKGLIPYKGKPMISYSIDLLSKFCGRLLLSSSSDIYDSFGLERIPDIIQNSGPIVGLLSCLRVSKTNINFCLPCDTPGIPSEVIGYLLKEAFNNPGKCIIPLTPMPEPLIAVYPTGVASLLETLITSNEYRMTKIFEQFPVKYIPLEKFPSGNKDIFLNINTKNDIQ